MDLRPDDHDGRTIQVAIETDAGLVEIVSDDEMSDRRIVLRDAHMQGLSAGVRNPSKSDVDLVLRRCAPIDRPIDVARAVESAGPGLAEAHKPLNRIVADEAVALRVSGADRARMVVELAAPGVSAG